MGDAEEDAARARALRERISAALRETPAERARIRFSPYLLDEGPDIAGRLMRAASPGGLDGFEAALDEYDELAGREDLGRLRHALMVFLTHHPEAARLGLRVPPLEERSAWKVSPGRDDPAGQDS